MIAIVKFRDASNCSCRLHDDFVVVIGVNDDGSIADNIGGVEVVIVDTPLFL